MSENVTAPTDCYELIHNQIGHWTTQRSSERESKKQSPGSETEAKETDNENGQ